MGRIGDVVQGWQEGKGKNGAGEGREKGRGRTCLFLHTKRQRGGLACTLDLYGEEIQDGPREGRVVKAHDK
jgi:hypothetical protein